MSHLKSNDKEVLFNTLDSEQKKQYKQGVLLRTLDGCLNAVAVIFAFYCLIWVTSNGEVSVILPLLIVVTIAIVFARFAFSSMAMRLLYGRSYDGSLKLRREVLRHLTRLPLGAFRKLHSGKVSQTLSEDMMWLENNDSFFKPNMRSEIIMIVLLLAAVAVLSWQTALATVLVWACGLFFVYKLNKVLETGMRFRSDGMSESARHIMEYVDGMQVIRSFGDTRAAERDFHKWVGIMREGFVKGIKRNTPIAAKAHGLAICAVGVGAIVGVLTHNPDANAMWLAAALGLLTATIIPARAFISANSVARLADVGIDNIANINAIEAIDDGVELAKSGSAELFFENVSFSYPSDEIEQAHHSKALDSISFIAKPRSVTAIVGPSGSGKTTLANVMLRFFENQDGNILLNGKRIDKYTIESYMDRFAVVFQETTLFRDSIANNIRVGNPQASMDEIIQAAKAAQIHDTIMTLPNGYEEVVGADGSTLSGGERQRVTIARAILKDSDIVILDEATSALDPENEHEIQQAFEALSANKTVFIIAHRLSTIVDADNILLLEKGKLVAQGKHDDLLKNQPLYQSLWASYEAISEWQL
ncbi:MAG: ABC transporter ATP-binding protein [Pseudomonadota bacterium]